MSIIFLWQTYEDEWALEERVSFDGPNRKVYVHENVTQLSIREHLYSAWVRWLNRDNNTQYLPAMRFSGADPIPGGETGVIFFLTNGWKLIYDANIVSIDGVLYSDNYQTAFWSIDDKPIYPTVVSALVNSVVTVQNVVTGIALTESQTAQAVWQANNRTLTYTDSPTKEEIATQIRLEIAAELVKILEIAKLHGLMVDSPLIVSPNNRQAGDINQSITTFNDVTTVQRV